MPHTKQRGTVTNIRARFCRSSCGCSPSVVGNVAQIHQEGKKLEHKCHRGSNQPHKLSPRQLSSSFYFHSCPVSSWEWWCWEELQECCWGFPKSCPGVLQRYTQTNVDLLSCLVVSHTHISDSQIPHSPIPSLHSSLFHLHDDVHVCHFGTLD